MFDTQSLAAQNYLTVVFDLNVNGFTGRHGITHEQHQAMRKALSLRVRGRAVDERVARSARAGLQRVPPQVRQNIAYGPTSPDDDPMLMIERIARHYESVDYDEAAQ